LPTVAATDGYLLRIKVKHKRRGTSLGLSAVKSSRVVIVRLVSVKIIVLLDLLLGKFLSDANNRLASSLGAFRFLGILSVETG
jgi:hypothetical protein